MQVSEVSTYSGPYARLREVIGAERAHQYDFDSGAYSKGYIDALNAIETVIAEMENAMDETEE
mgnify:FL=1